MVGTVELVSGRSCCHSFHSIELNVAHKRGRRQRIIKPHPVHLSGIKYENI